MYGNIRRVYRVLANRMHVSTLALLGCNNTTSPLPPILPAYPACYSYNLFDSCNNTTSPLPPILPAYPACYSYNLFDSCNNTTFPTSTNPVCYSCDLNYSSDCNISATRIIPASCNYTSPPPHPPCYSCNLNYSCKLYYFCNPYYSCIL